jgi:hypothetical protein
MNVRRIRSIMLNSRLVSTMTFAAVIAMGLASCERKPVLNNNQLLADIKAQSGVALPSTAQVLEAGDAGSREPGFYEWTVYIKSPYRIQMPSRSGSVNSSEKRSPDETAVKGVELAIGTKIESPVSSAFSIWETQSGQCQGTLVRTKEGEYFYLRKFSKQLGAPVTNSPK